jgi:hypothetical protein
MDRNQNSPIGDEDIADGLSRSGALLRIRTERGTPAEI